MEHFRVCVCDAQSRQHAVYAGQRDSKCVTTWQGTPMNLNPFGLSNSYPEGQTFVAKSAALCPITLPHALMHIHTVHTQVQPERCSGEPGESTLMG